MKDLTNKYLLMIEPLNNTTEYEATDKYTEKMQTLLKNAAKGKAYKGIHICACGERSKNYDLKIGKYITNSLAVHYLKYHRSEVPISEIEKLDNL